MAATPRRMLLLAAALLAALAVVPAAQARGLAAPRLAAPLDSAQVDAVPSFTWNAVRGAASYEFQLAADARFASSVLGTTSNSLKTANTAATITNTLADGTYYWRVRSVAASGSAGAWSSTRSLMKAWTTPPTLLAPNDMFAVTWPSAPLVLQWSAVPHAVSYLVTVATDPSLAQAVVGGAKAPLETQGTTFAVPAALAPGTYYWAVVPKDAAGHPGAQSRVGTFTWGWPTVTTPQVNDLNADPRVFDPQFSWAAVPGAARYQVEVNASHDWTPGSKVCCTDPTTGTSLSPTSLLANNTYYWRMRAVDAQGDVGQWNEGPSFQKDFDPVGPQVPSTIPNLRLRDATSDPLIGTYPIATANPIVEWDPVPGASSYEVQLLPWTGVGCSEQNLLDYKIDGLAWTPLDTGARVGPASWPNPDSAVDLNLRMQQAGTTYCVRVLAQSKFDSSTASANGFISDWTWINGVEQPAFTLQAQPSPGSPGSPFATPASAYHSPVGPPSTTCVAPSSDGAPCMTRLPLFTWDRVAGAVGYYVVVARDQAFTQVIDVAYTTAPAYAIRDSTPTSAIKPPPPTAGYTDESSHYYWIVMPSGSSGVTSTPAMNNPQAFDKQSIPPAPLAPANGAAVTSQPVFNWGPAESARSYRLQVSTDPNFGTLLDDVTTDSTAYTSSTTYPVDTILYWRVRAVDTEGIQLNWSATSTFRRTLSVPTAAGGNPTAGSDIPSLAWSSVPGAVSYGVHVDYPNGQTKDLTVFSTIFTPTEFYGNGVWRWKVKANFPDRNGNPATSSAYSSSQPFTRSIPAPGGGLATRTKTRVLISWSPNPHAYHYRMQTSLDSSFASLIDSITTDGTSYAPTLTNNAYRTGGTVYWRVAAIDKGNNQGAFATGTFTLPRGFRIMVTGALRHGARRKLVVRLTDGKGRAVRGASVTLRGAGIRQVTRRSGRKGTATFTLRPKRRGTITIRVHKSGYVDGSGRVRVS